MDMTDLGGVFAPLTTPFDGMTGEMDLVALRANVRRLVDTELRGLVLYGTTGEGPLLGEGERLAGLEAVRELAGEKLILSGIASESTRGAIRLGRAAAAAGAHGVLVAPPGYYRPQLTPEALREHYRAIADEVPVPVLLYQVPTVYASVTLAAGLAAELANHPNIAGIKDSSGDLRALGALIETCPRDFAVLVGSGTIFYGGLEVGARGGILAVADLVPDVCCDLYRFKLEGREAEAGNLQEKLAHLHRDVVAAFGVAGVKAALDLLGSVGGDPRPPLRPLRDKDRRAIGVAVRTAVGR